LLFFFSSIGTFGYWMRKKTTNLPSASYGAAWQKLYKVEYTTPARKQMTMELQIEES